MNNNPPAENVRDYEIRRSILFANDRGLALAENPNAPQPFVTWQFTKSETGKRDYYWGHYFNNADRATKDFDTRVADYQKSYGIAEKVTNRATEVYKYYSTQRPVDIGTFPKTEGGPTEFLNFDKRESVEHGRFRAWGYLLYSAPLTEKQIADYELRPAPSNPERKWLEEQIQVVGQWEKKHQLPEDQWLTWWYPDFGVFVKNELILDARLIRRYEIIMEKSRVGRENSPPKSIVEQLKEGAEKAEKGNAIRPASKKDVEKNR